MKPKFLMAALLPAFLAFPASAEQTLLLRQPDISADHLAFVYAGDIWVSGRDGSEPRRLTSHPAEENSPSFSPDGSLIAFAANYENNTDVYVVSVDGGQPKRLTWHPADDVPTGWTPDGGAVTFVSNRETDHGRSGQLYHASLTGGLPTRRMQARVYRGVYDASGDRFAYIAFGSGYNGLFGGTSGWKGYRGGTTPAIQVMDMQNRSVATVPGAGATNFNPVWMGNDVYFISDRDAKIHNLFRYDTDSRAVRKVSAEDTWDVRSAGGHDGVIVYESGGRLKSLDTASGAVAEIVVEINPDLPQRMVQWKEAGKTIQSSGISPTGKRAILTARGEVFTVPVGEGPTRNISNTGATREYTATWSPDGEQVAFIADSRTGQSLVVTDQSGTGNRQTFPLGPHFYRLLAWSPGDNARIVFEDNHLGLHAIDLADGDITLISTGTRRDQVDVSVSTDGRWLAYTEEQPNYNRSLKLYEFANGRSVAVTDDAADVAAPAFSRDGKYLFFAASTNSGPTQVGTT